MRAGKLDRRVTIQQPLEQQSDSGEVQTVWTDIATVWAEMVNLPGNERYSMQQLVGHALMTLKLRYSATTKQITVKWRLKMDDRLLDITDVRETRTHEELQIDCFTASEQPVTP